tara:strand:+ start:14730 stop:16001 length:1272 start_codon:yes stop_codon:yes gene_type:complete
MAKYSELTEKQKNDLADYYARELHLAIYPSDPRNQERNPIAFGFGGTVEDALRRIGAEINKYGKAGSVDLINRISEAQATVKGSDFINEALNPNLKGTRKEPYFEEGLRQALITDLSDFGADDETEILSLFSYADDDMLGKTDKEQIALSKGDINKAYTDLSSALETEQDISDDASREIGLTKTEPSDEGLSDQEPSDEEPSDEEPSGTKPSDQETSGTKPSGKPPTAEQVINDIRNKPKRLTPDEEYFAGYAGGYDQFLKDKATLAPTRLGKREPDGSFRLRTGEEVAARIREGTFNIQQPKARAFRNFRDLVRGYKQFKTDTNLDPKVRSGETVLDDPINSQGLNPLAMETAFKAKEAREKEQQTKDRERQKREMLDEQFKVKEPPEFTSEFNEEIKGLSPKERAEVLRMVKEKEDKMFGR